MLKNLVTALVLIGLIHLIYRNRFNNQELVTLGVMVLALTFALDQMNLSSPKARIFSGTEEQGTGMGMGGSQLQQLINDHVIRVKLYLNSYIDNHADRYIWYQLLRENAKEMGSYFSNPQLTQVLLKKIKAMARALEAIWSENQRNVEASLNHFYQTGAEVAQVITSLNPEALPYEDVLPKVQKANSYLVQMALARVAQNWQKDAQYFDMYKNLKNEMVSALSNI